MSVLLRRNSRGPHPVRVRAGQALDSLGDPVESWAEADVAKLPLPGATIEHVEVEETERTGSRRIRREVVLFAFGAPDVRAADRVEHFGDVWRVDGDPVTRTGLASSVYTRATLTRVTG